MTDRWTHCPACHNEPVNIGGEGDDVTYTCDRCGVTFTVAEAKRGHLFVQDEKQTDEIANLRKRVDSLEIEIKDLRRRMDFIATDFGKALIGALEERAK